MKKTFPTNRQRTTIFQQILLHFAPFLLQKNNHNEKKSLEREDKETTDINDGGEQKSRGEEEEEETQSKIMSFTDRNPLSLSMPQHNLKQLTKQLERDWNDEEEKRRREDAMRNEKSTHHAEERGSRNSNNNFNNIRGGGGNGGALRIDNVLVEDRPKLAYLTIEDLKKKAKPWREFFSTDYWRK